MGVLPLQFLPGQDAASLGLTGRETYEILGLSDAVEPRSQVAVTARGESGEVRFEVVVRLDGAIEVDYYRQGGILPAVLRRLAAE